jgi:hypothetical protein
MLLKIKREITWESQKSKFDLSEIVVLSSSIYSDPIIGKVIDIVYYQSENIFRYLVSWNNMSTGTHGEIELEKTELKTKQKTGFN